MGRQPKEAAVLPLVRSTKAAGVGVLLILVAAGCGSKTSAAPVPTVSFSTALAPVTDLATTVHAHDVLVSWNAAAGPVDGYAVYLDSRKPVFVSSTTGHELFGDVPGGSHFVQVVTKDGAGVSDPVGAKVHVRQPRPINKPTTSVVTSPQTTTPVAPATSTPVSSSPSTSTFTGKFVLVEGVLIPGDAKAPKSCLSLRGTQFVLSDGSGDALGVSGTPELIKTVHPVAHKGSFAATCTYSYSIGDVPRLPIYKLTITGYGTNMTFTAIDPVQGQVISASQIHNGAIPEVLGDLRIGF
jgi:hypothetical protein